MLFENMCARYKFANNVVNIRFSPSNNWKGQISPKRGFCQFDNVYSCCRAFIILYNKRSSFSLRAFVTVFAPPSDGNDTERYISLLKDSLNSWVINRGCKTIHFTEKTIISFIDPFLLFLCMSKIESGLFYPFYIEFSRHFFEHFPNFKINNSFYAN